MQILNETVVLAATDLANHLACRHLTQLNALAAVGDLEKPIRKDALLLTLIERGLGHENAYVEHLRSSGKSVCTIEKEGGRDKSQENTATAMKEGFDVIVQGAFGNEKWYGLPGGN